MATPPELAARHAAQRIELADAVAAIARQQWSKVDRRNIGPSWLRQLARLLAFFVAAQKAAAQSADAYTALASAGAAAEAAVAAGAFAGQAADGRNLVTLFMQPVVTALTAIGEGHSVDDAMKAAGGQLDMICRTEIADAGRTADQVAMIARPDVEGYIRVIAGDTCNRCIILAGRWYSYSEWFERHPNCDCVMLPAKQAESLGLVQDPRGIYEEMTRRERTEAGWTHAEQEAIDEGSDLAAVTNARRGVYTAGGKRYTREGTTRRGIYGGYDIDPETGKMTRRPRGSKRKPPRLTPQQIFEDAADRDEAIRLLRQYGYLFGTPQPAAAKPAPESLPAAPKPKPLHKPKPANEFGDDYEVRQLTEREVQIRDLERAQQTIKEDSKRYADGWEKNLKDELAKANPDQSTVDYYRRNLEHWRNRPASLKAELEALRTAKNPELDQPTKQVVRTGTPSMARAKAHLDKVVSRGLRDGDRASLVAQLTNQARLSTRTAMRLLRVSEPLTYDEREYLDDPKKSNVLAFYVYGERKMIFSPKPMADRAALTRTAEQCARAKWWTPTGTKDGLENTCAHEYGHHVDATIFERGPSGTPTNPERGRPLIAALGKALAVQVNTDADNPWREINRIVDDNKAAVRGRVSEYGSTNGAEMLAEIWQEWSTMGKNARPHIQVLGKLMQKLADEGALH